MTWNCRSRHGAWLGLSTVLGLALAAGGASGPLLAQQAASAGNLPGDQQAVTFAKDIAPILQRSCQGCHRPGAGAPMSLITYQEVRPWVRAIKTKTGLRSNPGTMPPWYVDKSIGIQEYKNDPSLSEEEVVKIAKWADNGAPMGNPADMPAPKKFAGPDEWAIGQPDFIVNSKPFEMKASSPDWWGVIGDGIVPSGLTEDRYVAAIEYKEVTDSQQGDRQTVGGRFIVHHTSFTAVGPGETPDAGTRFPTHEVGRNSDVFDPGMGRLIKANSDLVFSAAHLHSNGGDTKAHLEIGFKFHPKGYKPTSEYRQMGLFGNSMNLALKPMQADQKFEGFTVLQENAKIIAFEPHMHAAGVRMCLDAITGASMTLETLSCVNYDHSWVRIYTFADDAAPLLPKGTILRITGTFDNTPANRNVADPRNWSGLGHRSIDQMMNSLGEVLYLTDEQFEAEMATRRARLGLKFGESPIGCPLCGAGDKKKQMPSTTAGGNQ